MGWSIESLMCGNKFLGYVYKSMGGSFDASHCAVLQQRTTGKQINSPGKPYVSPMSPDDVLDMADDDGFVGVGADAGTGQCVALVKAAVPALGATKDPLTGDIRWVKGDDVDSFNVPFLLPGTVIGYGFNADGEYAGRSHGNHVAIFISADGDKVTIIDQWKSPTTHRSQEARQSVVEIDNKDWAIVTLSEDAV